MNGADKLRSCLVDLFLGLEEVGKDTWLVNDYASCEAMGLALVEHYRVLRDSRQS